MRPCGGGAASSDGPKKNETLPGWSAQHSFSLQAFFPPANHFPQHADQAEAFRGRWWLCYIFVLLVGARVTGGGDLLADGLVLAQALALDHSRCM